MPPPSFSMPILANTRTHAYSTCRPAYRIRRLVLGGLRHICRAIEHCSHNRIRSSSSFDLRRAATAPRPIELEQGRALEVSNGPLRWLAVLCTLLVLAPLSLSVLSSPGFTFSSSCLDLVSLNCHVSLAV
ncbi:hypothetical protein HDV57DRAFT_326764 [Trichoderma longibrachiatum]|uniref:Uncharacterized protein n=1 Tax=Trichoderma longibrachiatum ATCC 18648 TaxID=983965 RepID=A0A2T4BVW0_TRILO|nr:hypothetical protein M440DRAFT_1062840 [Trichoderma longibrachiatum ATCC 18648]